MNQPRKKRRTSPVPAEITKRRSSSPPPAVSPSSSSSSSASAPTAVDDFRDEDRALLSFIALSAAQSTMARSAEVVLDTVLTSSSASSSSSNSSSASATSPPTASENGTLADRYPEVRVLLHLHCLRGVLRDLQDCPPHARRTFYTMLEKHVTELAEVLPDPLFLAFATVLKNLLAHKPDDDALDKHRCHLLEMQLMHVVGETQMELLRTTKLLSVRAGLLTLRFHHDVPYL